MFSFDGNVLQTKRKKEKKHQHFTKGGENIMHRTEKIKTSNELNNLLTPKVSPLMKMTETFHPRYYIGKITARHTESCAIM